MNQPQPPQYGGHPQQPGGAYQPPAGYELKKKKRRKWPWILGAIVLLLVIIGVSTGGNNTPASNTGPAAPTAPAAGGGSAGDDDAAASGGITYEVTTSDGSGTALITYTSDKNFNQSQENGAKLPWKKTVDLGSGFFTGASLVAQAGQGVDSISCKVSDGDRVISENTSTGQFAVVTCSGS